MLKSQAHEWYDIGSALRVPPSTLDGLVKATQAYTDNAKLQKVIDKWLLSYCSPPTWDNLIKALEGMQWRAVAEEVKEFLKTDPKAKEPGMYITR